jgi:ABC-2 type transport system ATP-binding protein
LTLIVDSVSKRFGATVALDGASFRVRAGEVFGFLGSNGAGKTTMMRIILGLLRPDRGSITWGGHATATLPRSTWGYLPEERGLYPRMTVRDELLFFAGLQGVPEAHAGRRVDAWLERLQIAEHAGRRVDELSKGNQQKVQFIAAVAHEPDVYLLDEPFSGLDPLNAAILREAILELRDRGHVVIFSTHHMATAESLCTALAIVDRGRVVLGGTLRDLKRGSGRKVVRVTLDGATTAGPGAPDAEAGVLPGSGERDPAAWLRSLPGVGAVRAQADVYEVDLERGASPNVVLGGAIEHGRVVTRFEVGEPSLEEIFVEHVGRPAETGAGAGPGGAGVRSPDPGAGGGAVPS